MRFTNEEIEAESRIIADEMFNEHVSQYEDVLVEHVIERLGGASADLVDIQNDDTYASLNKLIVDTVKARLIERGMVL